MNLREKIAKIIAPMAGVDFDLLPYSYKAKNLVAADSILSLVRQEVEKRDWPSYDDFKKSCGLRPRDICFNCGVQDERQSILALLGGIEK